VAERCGRDSRAAAAKLQEPVRGQDDPKRFQSPTVRFRNRPAAHLSETDLHLPGALHLGFHGPPKPIAKLGALRQSRMTDPQVIEAACGPLFQVTETGANAAAGIERQHVPAMFIDADLVAAVGQIVTLDGTVAKIHATAKTLHFRKKIVVPPGVDFNVAEAAGDRGPGRWRKDYKSRLGPGARKYHVSLNASFPVEF
jgi:hypothetical protein